MESDQSKENKWQDDVMQEVSHLDTPLIVADFCGGTSIDRGLVIGGFHLPALHDVKTLVNRTSLNRQTKKMGHVLGHADILSSQTTAAVTGRFVGELKAQRADEGEDKLDKAPGSRAGLLPPSPLRIARESFPSSSSSPTCSGLTSSGARLDYIADSGLD
jgi:hypothetical protein